MIRILAIASMLATACSASQPDRLDQNLGGTGGKPPPKHLALRVHETDLAASTAGVAANTVPDLVNAWGLAVDPDGPALWIAANGTDTAQVLAPSGAPTGQVVSVPGAPTGEVYTESPDFMGDEFIFATEGGTILGWQDAAGEAAVLRADDSASGAEYKGLAVFRHCTHDAIATTDFAGAKIDVYGPGYGEIEDAGFVDPELPADFAPFGIAALGGDVYVSYAKVGPTGDDVAGPGNGFVDVFHGDGTLVRRLISGGHLNSPWGMALAPEGWGKLSNKLLVGNFGDGMINVYQPDSGTWLGALADDTGAPLTIEGLWALVVSNGTLYFTAGPDDEQAGLFGTLAPM